MCLLQGLGSLAQSETALSNGSVSRSVGSLRRSSESARPRAPLSLASVFPITRNDHRDVLFQTTTVESDGRLHRDRAPRHLRPAEISSREPCASSSGRTWRSSSSTATARSAPWRTAARTTTRRSAKGRLDAHECTIECPRHGSVFDLRTGRPLTLPAYSPAETYPVTVENDVITLEVE